MEGETQKGEIRTEGLGMLVGVRELAKSTRRARIGHRSPLRLRPRSRRLARDMAEEGSLLSTVHASWLRH
jgi:hypothetical protein